MKSVKTILQVKRSSRMQKSISFFVIFSILWGSLFLFSIIGSLGTTPIPLTKDSKFLMSSILPQGWGFFSKNPRDTAIGLYEAENASAKVRCYLI